MSASESKRAEGNKLYQSCKNDWHGLAPILRESKLKDARTCYQLALNLATTQDEKCSASKNLGVINFALAKLIFEKNGQLQTKEVTYSYVEALTNYSAALNLGSCKAFEWRDLLLQSLQECTEEAMEGCSLMPFEDRWAILRRYSDCLESKFTKAKVLLHLANLIFHEGITCFQNKDGKRCLYLMKECHFPIEEARKNSKLHECLMKEVSILEEEVYIYTCISESLIARTTGDDLFKIALEEEETINMDLVWEIIDWYKQAILLTRENDPETEAIAHSRLGNVYDKVLKLKSKASENFKRALELALTMKPRTFESEDWFRLCTQTLERYQKEVVEQEDVKWQKHRAKYVEELKEEIKTLDAKKNRSHKTFLGHIYETFPPKDPNHKLKKIPSEKDTKFKETMKKIYRDAVIHYHPDRADVEKNGEKWKVICEEITKRLTLKYEYFK